MVRSHCHSRGTLLPTIFLCGPITGIPSTSARTWREQAREMLAGTATTIDPTRDLPDSVRYSESSTEHTLTITRLIHGKRTVARNRFDIGRADIVLACFLGTEAVSIGSVGEIFWADAMGKPVIIVREDNNLHNHDMLNEIAGWISNDLESAIENIRRLLQTD
jgi:hypothetical protein